MAHKFERPIPATDAHDHAAAAQDVEGGSLFGQPDRMVERDHIDSSPDLDRLVRAASAAASTDGAADNP